MPNSGCGGLSEPTALTWVANGNPVGLEGAWPYRSSEYADCCDLLKDKGCTKETECKNYECNMDRLKGKRGAALKGVGSVPERSATALMQASVCQTKVCASTIRAPQTITHFFVEKTYTSHPITAAYPIVPK